MTLSGDATKGSGCRLPKEHVLVGSPACPVLLATRGRLGVAPSVRSAVQMWFYGQWAHPQLRFDFNGHRLDRIWTAPVTVLKHLSFFSGWTDLRVVRAVFY